MNNERYVKLWLVFVNIKAKDGNHIHNLVDDADAPRPEQYVGAWANLIIKADTINKALEIVPAGLAELGFTVEFIDKVENFSSLVENGGLNQIVLDEGQWLLESDFVFKISDRIFPYL